MVGPYLGGVHAPVDGERTDEDLPIEGVLPARIRGCYLRNSPNPRFTPPGRPHWFDGDGMVHSVHLDGGQAHYRNRWIRTPGLAHEEEAGKALWGGIHDPPDFSLPGGPLKDTANTDLIAHQGRVYALWWLSGRPMELEVPSLRTVGPAGFAGRHTVSAHAKVDPRSNQLVFFGYDTFRRPYYHLGVVDPDGTLVHTLELDLPHAHIPHDIALTERFTVVMDFPLGWDRSKGRNRIRFFEDRPSRIGVVPRLGSEVRWFDVQPCYVYHTIGAWEDGDTIELIACRIADPIPERPTPGVVPRLDLIELVPHLYRWRLDLGTGEVTEEQLDTVPTEFPTADPRYATRPLRWAWAPTLAEQSELLFDGFVRYDLQSGTSKRVRLPVGHFGGELVFVPDPDDASEGAGWVCTVVSTDDGTPSRLVLWDAVSTEPVCAITLPWRVPPGFHATWAPL